MSPFDPDRFVKGNTCLPCCATPVAGCACALLIPTALLGGTPPYASYADAVSGIADFVADCIGYGIGPGAIPLDSYSVNIATADSVIQNANVTAAGAVIQTAISINLKAGSILTVAWNDSFTGDDTNTAFSWTLYRCDGSGSVDGGSSEDLSGSMNSSPISEDGEYILVMSQDNDDDPTACTINWTVSSDDTLTTNPVIALWDDSGTTRSLWACPKLLLPLGTELSGDWYASCADAYSDILDWASGCIGYCNGSDPSWLTVGSFLASGSSSLTLTANGWEKADAGATPGMVGGINAVAGDTISFAWTTSSTPGTIGVEGVTVALIDDTGATIYSASGSGASGTLTTTAPYTGRYTVSATGVGKAGPGPGSPNTVDCSVTITSSGTMSVNPIQARYDAGLTCAGLLDCGDACP